ncbi:MAG: DegT/DnrJ/EryC1/StrS family aminotransferase [Candidatus Puniceispirillaceae bacterium]
MTITFIDLKTQQERIRAKIENGIQTVLDHGAYIMGPEIDLLENRLAEWTGVKHNISCSSGTDALILALMGLEIKAGQGIIVPSFTFAASAEVIPLMGAIPVFAEVDGKSFNLDPEKMTDALAAGKAAGIDVVGIIGVGLFGQPANYPAIKDFARKNRLWLIDDAAQSFGAQFNGQPVGQLADVTCTSFFPAKPLGAYGDGGAVFTNDCDIAEIIRSCRIHGMGHNKYENVRIGITGRLDSIQAVVLDAKLDIFSEELLLRQQVANRYENMLKGVVGTPILIKGTTSSWAQYVIKLPKGADRKKIIKALDAADVPTAIYYPVPVHQQPIYSPFPTSACNLPVTLDLCSRVLALPMHPYLEVEHQRYIATSLKAALD